MVWLWVNITAGHVAKTENRPAAVKPQQIKNEVRYPLPSRKIFSLVLTGHYRRL